MAQSSFPREVKWTVLPLETPDLVRHCGGCRETRSFRCSERFRVNCNKLSIDVWLIYRCVACDSTWNAEIIARRSVRTIEAELYAKFLANDAALARRFAFDSTMHRRWGVPGSSRAAFEIVGAKRAPRVRIAAPHAGIARMDQVLARGLTESRSFVAKLACRGEVAALPADPRFLRRPLKGGELLVLSGAALSPRFRRPTGPDC